MHENFESLEIPRRESPQLTGTRYRVYSDHSNYKLVEAATALEAIQSSGMEKICRVERDTMLLNAIITLATMPETTAKAQPPAEAVPQSPNS